jgi:hypothetical protein
MERNGLDRPSVVAAGTEIDKARRTPPAAKRFFISLI